ncbi:MAG: YitT family protein [Caldilineaceae bacterium]|nr:YitT family protein [Caldilineaceae bacterium]
MTASQRYFIARIFLLTLGALTSATGVLIFLLPHQIAPSGVSGVGVILNSFSDGLLNL